MGYFLATEQGDPIVGMITQRQNTIMARIFANQNWEHFPPSKGNRVHQGRLRTAAEQRELEDHLRPLAAAEND